MISEKAEFGDFWGQSTRGLVAIKLISFRAAHMMLCFRYVTETVSIINQCFSCHSAVLAHHQGLLCFPLHSPQRVGLGWARDRRRAQLAQLTQINQRDIQYHITSCSVIKPGEFFQPKEMLLGDRLTFGLLVGCWDCFCIFFFFLPPTFTY